MSSYLSKSKKDFRPKAPVRRTAAPTSQQNSVRGSVEPQTHSQNQTPQPPALNPPTPSIPTIDVRSTSPASRTHHSPETVLTSFQEPEASRLTPEASRTAVSKPLTTPNVEPQSSETQRNVSPDPLPEDQNEVPTSYTRNIQSPRVHQTQTLSPAPPSIASSGTAEGSRRADPLPSPPPTAPIQSLDATIQFGEDETEERASDEHATKRQKLDTLGLARSDRSSARASSTHSTRSTENQGSGTREAPAQSTVTSTSKRRKPRATNANKRQKRRKQPSQRGVESVGAEETNGGNDSDTNEPRRRGRKRAVTPDDAESARITPTTMKMSDLCRDNRMGKKSSREIRLQEREVEDKRKRAREELQAMMDDTAPPDAQETESNNHRAPVSRATPPATSAARIAPQVRLVNGQIVQDEDSCMIDRHERAEASRLTEDIQEEDELTRRITSFSYSRHPRTKNKWDAEQTSRFHEGLRLFGTDFMTINRIMFPKLTRRAIKTKFTHEERADEEFIKHLLIHERKVPTLEEVEEMSQIKLKDPTEVYRGMEEDREKLEEEARVEREAIAEVERQRVEEARRENEAATAAAAAAAGRGRGGADGGGGGDGDEEVEKENEGGVIDEGEVEVLDDGDDAATSGKKKKKKGARRTKKQGLRTAKGKRVLASA